MAQLATSEEMNDAERYLPQWDLGWLANLLAEQHAWRWMLLANSDPDDWRTKRERTK
jgi:hypothetical protein